MSYFGPMYERQHKEINNERVAVAARAAATTT